MYLLDWPFAYGHPRSTALFKQTPEDFQVDEYFDCPFSGEGEHIVLQIEKKGLNTEEVVKALARLVNKPTKLISYAGLKDRHALTTQWLSIHAPGEDIPGVDQLSGTGWRVLACHRHHKKLRPGYLAGNQFKIKLRDITHPDDLIQRIEQIKRGGVPNYFGEQRFGRECGNLVRAELLLVQGKRGKDRFLQGMYCSAARSWLYNLILAHRVRDLNWNLPVEGDVMQLNGSKSIFVIDTVDEDILNRVQSHDISPASPLPGKSKHMVKGKAQEMIAMIYADWQTWLVGLEKQGLEEAWRANMLNVNDMEYIVDDQTMELSFTLPAGSYATAVLREMAVLL